MNREELHSHMDSIPSALENMEMPMSGTTLRICLTSSH